jgi:hypothetical protein
MTLSSLLVHTVSVKRATATTGIKKTYQAAATGVRCLIQPLDPEAQETVKDGWGRDYKAFFLSGTDIREGDQLTDQSGRIFSVRGVRLRNYGPAQLQHLEALLGQDRAV